LPTIKVELDPEIFRLLSELAVEERRPIPWQAEVLLIRALTSDHAAQAPPPPSQEVPCAPE
jgi:hypothetical protein